MGARACRSCAPVGIRTPNLLIQRFYLCARWRDGQPLCRSAALMTGEVIAFPRRDTPGAVVVSRMTSPSTFAPQFHSNRLRMADNGDVPLPFPETLADTLDAWRLRGLAAGHSERTLSSRIGTIRRLVVDGLDPLSATADDLETWLATLVG